MISGSPPTITARDQAGAIRTLEAAIAVLKSMKVSRSCSDCEHWGPVGCALAGTLPPLDVQAFHGAALAR